MGARVEVTTVLGYMPMTQDRSLADRLMHHPG